jgi:sulfur-carrier protein
MAPSPAPSPEMTVHLDSWLREFGPRGNERVRAGSVEQVLDELERRYPRLRFKIRDETGQIRKFVRVFVNGEDVSATTGVGTRLEGSEAIDILHSTAGG